MALEEETHNARSLDLATTLNLPPRDFSDPLNIRLGLLDFVAEFANWDNASNPDYLEFARRLVQVAHESLGAPEGSRPLVVDPFAGGGAIPLEALRVGADAFASDLNPVAVLLNRVVLDYIPRYGQRLADEVRKWGDWVKVQADIQLAEFYPRDPDGSTPMAYLWARTILCEGPGCGAELPLLRGLWLAKKSKSQKSGRSVALRLVPQVEEKRIDFEILHEAKPSEVAEGTVRRGSATCLVCGFTTPVTSVRRQLKERRGGTSVPRMICVVTTRHDQRGRSYRLPTEHDLIAVEKARVELARRTAQDGAELSLVPDERLDIRGIRHTSSMIYGLEQWRDYFTPRQALALTSLIRLIQEVGEKMASANDVIFASAVQTCLSLNFDRVADLSNSLCGWKLDMQCPTHLFARQAIPMVWDFCESVCTSESSGSWSVMNKRFSDTLAAIGSDWRIGSAKQANAIEHPLPDNSADALITDPPYYDSVPYSHLSDFFYVWLRRSLAKIHPDLFRNQEVPKDEEIVVDRPHELSHSKKDVAFYERQLSRAFADGRRVLRAGGIGIIVFASKSTASWEAILQAIVDAGWVITGSWPIDTEMEARVAAQGQARLASSVHLVARPRENPDGSLRTNESGDWRDVLHELPRRIHEWMPRLAEEGVVGADAIFACLGPALEVFSRYSRVEKASGEAVSLKDYLVEVWAAVANEALSLIFKDADSGGLEPDARLTAMWLWTLSTSGTETGVDSTSDEESDRETTDADDEETNGRVAKGEGFSLEFDAARKIAQGLGAHLGDLLTVVEVKGKSARLLAVSERAKHLFGKGEGQAIPVPKKSRGRAGFLKGMEDVSSPLPTSKSWDEIGPPRTGATVLDRVHQAMILFGKGQAEALKRFVVEEGAGTDARFWKLAQSLSALYPTGTNEKRWVDGVLARKKGLGF
jgi:putative DNA methylase